ncbi:hypothetical protein GOP47_0022400 [Adiantum capillus-veneris]|uniref:RWD domain-containing protein n=1 Tax=Adiantum capillus-veneris TaxID=13818 RepID=A0A9D4U7P2_ADICA|nr:hypothetical protein GOP47_0022400 [Adiantum capillus-veneris]
MEDGEVEEEMMALESIFYDSFTKLEGNCFRVRIDPSPASLAQQEDEAGHTSNEIPAFDISNINNNPYTDFAKKAIVHGLQEQASSLIGESMCYTILEWLKDKLPELYSMKPVFVEEDNEGLASGHSQYGHKDPNSGKKDAKGKMTKAQKRRYFDRFGATAEKPRGWDWVSIISHVYYSCYDMKEEILMLLYVGD